MTPEEYADRHKKAFRCAFDYLNTHFPPENTDVWWDQAARDLSDYGIAAGENDLVLQLLPAVFLYLADERKRRYEHGKADS